MTEQRKVMVPYGDGRMVVATLNSKADRKRLDDLRAKDTVLAYLWDRINHQIGEVEKAKQLVFDPKRMEKLGLPHGTHFEVNYKTGEVVVDEAVARRLGFEL